MRNSLVLMLGTVLLMSGHAQAVKIADITRLSGQRTNILTGMGLVLGLHGTGDGGDYEPAMRPLAAMLKKFSNESTVLELAKTQNVAIVNVTATVPSTGAREGEKLDVRVYSIGAASNLKGGTLFVCPMMGPIPGSGIFALAQGPLDQEDVTDPNVAVVHGGAVLEVDMKTNNVEDGRFSLILEAPSANWTTAALIAKTINGAESLNGEAVAQVIDAKEISVTIPAPEREHPDSFISRVQQLPLIMLATEARVTINRKLKTLIVTGDVEISPVVISHNGLTIDTISPPRVGRANAPLITSRTSIPLDTTNQGGARLQDLVNALEQLRVPTDDRIAIVVELYKSGKLHAKVIEESN